MIKGKVGNIDWFKIGKKTNKYQNYIVYFRADPRFARVDLNH